MNKKDLENVFATIPVRNRYFKKKEKDLTILNDGYYRKIQTLFSMLRIRLYR